MDGISGLLDFAKTPEGQGLLAAVAGGLTGARRGTPINNIGRGAMAGLVGYSEAQKSSLELEQKKQMAALTKQMMGEMAGGDGSTMPNAQAALSQGAQGGSVGPTTQNAAVMDSMPPPQQSSGISLPTLQKAALLGMKNIEPLFNMHKYQKDGIERKAGSFYRNPTTGEEEYISDPTKGFNYDQKTKTVSPITGYSDTIAAQEGAKTRATEAAKADFNLLPLGYAGPDGRPIGGTVGNYINGLNSAQPAPQATQQTPQQAVSPVVPRSVPRLPGNRPDGFPVVTPQQQSSRDAESVRILNDELANEKDPVNQAALRREIANRSKGAVPVLQSEAEKEAQVGRVRVNNAVEEKRLISENERLGKDKRLYSQLSEAIPMARTLLQDATGSGAGMVADKMMAFFGKSTKGAEAAQALDTLGGWMVANVPRMEGPQSNIDVINYQTMAGRVADRTLPNEVRLTALDTLEELQNKYAKLNGFAVNEKSGGSGNLLNELPKPNGSNKGKIAIDHDTGKRWKSNGMKWEEVK